MHELSIAENIVEIIHQYVPAGERDRVRRVFTSVGEQSGVVADSLEFSFQAITAKTELERSHLEIETVPFIVQCKECGGANHGRRWEADNVPHAAVLIHTSCPVRTCVYAK
jgi:Zn finger protein HypA/HybF involved in hydrogenase expression